MDIDRPPEGDSNVYRGLVGSHGEYLRDLHRLVLSAITVTAGMRIGQFVPFALYHHLLQLGRAVQALLVQGYADEALPLGRAMISTTMALMFIVISGDSDGWALRYWVQMDEVESRMLERELRLGRFDPARLERVRRDAQQARDGAIAAAAQEGIAFPPKLTDPVTKKVRKDTWTGLSDKALADRVGVLDWYESEYDYLSTISHAQAVSILPTLRTLMMGKLPVVGPHFAPPVAAVASSSNSLRYGSLAV